MFSKSTKLTTLVISAVKSIPKRFFLGYSALKNLDISGATSIALPTATSSATSASVSSDGAFHGCSSLTSLNLPGITTLAGATVKPALWGSAIDYSAFRGSSLASISLPNITSIEAYAFCDCSTLTTLYIGTNTSTVCTLENTNAIPSSVTTIYVPASLVDSYKSATNWSSYASKIKATP